MNQFKINKGFISQKLDGKMTIFDGDESVLYTFNETASYIFARLKSGWEEKRIAEMVAKKYKINPKKAHEDLKDLLTDLRRKKIITQRAE